MMRQVSAIPTSIPGHTPKFTVNAAALDVLAECTCGWRQSFQEHPDAGGSATQRAGNAIRGHMLLAAVANQRAKPRFPPGHDAEMRASGNSHYAKCECGWQSPIRPRARQARELLDAHRDQQLIHDVELHWRSDSGTHLVSCSCGWQSIEAGSDRRAAHALAAAHRQYPSDPSASIVHAAYVEAGTGGFAGGFIATCPCGWRSPCVSSATQAETLADEHNRDFLDQATSVAAGERLIDDALWRRHSDGGCDSATCVYCREERSELKRRRAAEINAQLALADERLLADPEESYVQAVVDTLEWVLRQSDTPPV